MVNPPPFERILTSVNEGIVVLDRDLRYIFINEAAGRLVGMEPQAALGRTPMELFPPEAIEGALSQVRHALESGEPARYDAYNPIVDRWYENRVFPSADGAVLFFSDITARKREDERARRSGESQQLLISIGDAARSQRDPDDVMWSVVTQVGRHFRVGRCTYGDIDAAETHVLVSRDYTDGIASVVGRHRLEDFGPPLIRDLKAGRTVVVPNVARDPRTMDAASLAAFAAIETQSLLCVPLVKDGRFVALFVLHHSEPRAWTDEDVWLMEEIAERTWVAVERARAEAALRENRDVLALAMRGGRMGAWSRNLITDDVWWSRELEELFGLPPGGFEGTEAGFFTFVHADDRATVEHAVAYAIETRSDYAVQFRFRHANGEWRWMDGRGRAVYGADGSPRSLYGLGIDITEQKAFEAELARARDAAEAANQAKDEFLAMLGHELRNPLSPILTAVQLMKLRASHVAERERTVIERQVNHLTRLVDDLLDVSRIARGKVELKRQVVDLAEVVARAIEIASPLLEERTHVLTIDMPPRALPVDADPARLGQVVSNLLTNAAKYTPPGGRITIAAGLDGGAVELSVRDSGVGIAPEILPRIFDLFVQGRQPLDRSEGGLGLGLAIVRSLVERHGGSVRVHSEGPDRGSEFVVRLPLVEAPVDPSVAATETAVARLSPSQPIRVLVVDDNEDAAEMLALALQMSGYETRVAHDGLMALQRAEAERFDAACVDIGLPVMDGYELASKLRVIPSLAGIRLIAVTGYGQVSDRERALAAGFDHHVVKPVDLDGLQKLLADLQPSA